MCIAYTFSNIYTNFVWIQSNHVELLWLFSNRLMIKWTNFSMPSHKLFCRRYYKFIEFRLTHWGWVTHICVGKLIIIGSDNGLSPIIIWTNAGLLSIGPLRTYFSENLIKMQQFSLKKMHRKMLSAKWRPSCLGLHVLKRNRPLG